MSSEMSALNSEYAQLWFRTAYQLIITRRAVSPFTHYDSSLVGLKSIYKFNITDDHMVSLNAVEKAGYLIIVLKNDNNKPKTNPSLIMIEYKHGADVELIREGRPIQEIVSFGDVRYYKFVNSEPEVNSIKFHLTEISGDVEIEGLRTDPRLEGNGPEPIKGQNPIEFTETLLAPVYAKITAHSQATYALTVQLKHITDDFVSSIGLSENVKFKIKIKPNSSETFTVHPLYNSILFNYKSTGIVIAWCPE